MKQLDVLGPYHFVWWRGCKRLERIGLMFARSLLLSTFVT